MDKVASTNSKSRRFVVKPNNKQVQNMEFAQSGNDRKDSLNKDDADAASQCLDAIKNAQMETENVEVEAKSVEPNSSNAFEKNQKKKNRNKKKKEKVTETNSESDQEIEQLLARATIKSKEDVYRQQLKELLRARAAAPDSELTLTLKDSFDDAVGCLNYNKKYGIEVFEVLCQFPVEPNDKNFAETLKFIKNTTYIQQFTFDSVTGDNEKIFTLDYGRISRVTVKKVNSFAKLKKMVKLIYDDWYRGAVNCETLHLFMPILSSSLSNLNFQSEFTKLLGSKCTSVLGSGSQDRSRKQPRAIVQKTAFNPEERRRILLDMAAAPDNNNQANPLYLVEQDHYMECFKVVVDCHRIQANASLLRWNLEEESPTRVTQECGICKTE